MVYFLENLHRGTSFGRNGNDELLDPGESEDCAAALMKIIIAVYIRADLSFGKRLIFLRGCRNEILQGRVSTVLPPVRNRCGIVSFDSSYVLIATIYVCCARRAAGASNRTTGALFAVKSSNLSQTPVLHGGIVGEVDSMIFINGT